MWYLWSLETFVTSIYVGKVLSKLQLFHAEQMSLYNFIILRKKETPTEVYSCGICKTFKGSGGCLWKHVTYYYVIKNYIGYKLAIFNTVIFTLLDLLLTRWWDMRLKHDLVWLWEEQADSRNLCWNKKKYCSCCITLIRIDTILSKNIYNNFQNLLFRKLLVQSHAKQTYFGNFTCLQIYFGHP